jgi:transcriptional regulator with PAS, ATPase and Fis domain
MPEVQQNQPLEPEIADLFRSHGLVGAAPAMLPMLRQAARAAQVGDATLLIEGETGTGKQVLAAAIHAMDPKRRTGPMVTVHCGTIPDTLTESELFGHRRGAFSGAVSERKGLFAAANRGIIFLDDVNDLPPATQPKLLDVLQRNRIRPVGSDCESPVDVRVIAASNRPLQPLVDAGRFRADLYYRLDVIHLRIPALRERPEDLERLILAMAERHKHLYQPIDSVDPKLVRLLRGYAFPGNIRELEHMVQRMLFAKASGRSLTAEDLDLRDTAASTPAEDLRGIAERLLAHMEQAREGSRSVLASLEREMLVAALESPVRTRRDVARLFCMSERRLYQRLRALRLYRTA